VEIKGQEFIIRAMAKLQQSHPAVCCDIVGDGPLRQRLENLAAELGLQSRVTFHGAQNSSRVGELMTQAHLFVSASINVNGDQEGQGLVLQEAQASGLPVIATNHGAFPEGILSGKSGFLVSERDVDALVERLSFLIEHPETWPEMGRAGRKFVEENYDIRKLTSELTDIYTEAMDSSRYAQ